MITTGAYNEGFPGQGFDIFVRPHKTLVFWYTHDKRGLRYYFARGKPNDMKLFTTQGQDEVRIGDARLTDTDFIYDTTLNPRGDISRGAVPLHLIAEGDERSGYFHDPAHKGTGFSIMHFGNRMVIDWYNDRQQWVSCQGTPDNLDVKKVFGGSFRYPGCTIETIGLARLEGNVFVHESGTFRLERLF